MSDVPLTGGNPFKSILDVGTALASSASLDEVMAALAQRVAEAMMVPAAEVFAYDPATSELRVEAVFGPQVPDAGSFAVGDVVTLSERPDLAAALSSLTLLERHDNDKILSARDRELLAGHGYRTVLAAPVKLHGEAIGVMNIAETRFSRRFTPMEQEMFGQLVDLVAHALGNLRLGRRHETQNRRITALVEACRGLSSSLSLMDVTDRVALGVLNAFGVTSVDIYEYSDERDEVTCIWSSTDERGGDGPAFVGTVYALADHPSMRRAFELGSVVEYHLDDQAFAVADPGLHAEMEQWGEQSIVEVGLVFGDTVIGLLSIGSTERRLRFDADERALLSAFATLAAAAIHNARLFDGLGAQHERVATMVDIGRLLRSTADIGEVLGEVARLSGRLLDCDRVLIYDYDAAADTVRERGAWERVPTPGYLEGERPVKVDDAALDRAVLRSSEPLVEYLSDEHLDEGSRESMLKWGEQTCLNVPLVLGGEMVGVLMFIETGRERRYLPDELQLAGGIARQAAVAIMNLRLTESLLACGVDPESVGTLGSAL